MAQTALHGDVVGYSRLIADNEIETHNTVQTFRSIIEAVVTDHGGELAQFVGDEFLAVLPSERTGALAAIEIQRRLAEENLNLPEGRKMRFRLGLNSGEIHHGESGWFGDTINIAARLQAKADPGGITVSAAVFDHAGDLDVRHTSTGALRLKNIPEPVHAYRLVDDGLPTETDKPWRRRIPTSPQPSLAVSPFVNLGDPADDYFAKGLFMSLVVALMKIPGLDLKSENSSLIYSGQAYSAEQVGHELGARHVLEAAVHRAGDRVRVMTQLIDVEQRKTAWADRFESAIDDLFMAQDELVNQIVVALDLQVMGGGSRLYRDHLDPATVEVVYQAWAELITGTREGARKARDHFDAVTEMAPHSPIGHANAAWAYVWEVLQGWASDPEANIDRAEELASKAIEMGDPSGFAYAVMSYLRLVRQDWDGAYESALRATRERPSCDISFGLAASVMRFLGRWEEAVDLADHAIHLSPLMSDWYQGTMANAYYVGGDYEAAADTAESIVAGNEEDVEALLTLAASQSALGRERHASAAVRQARSSQPGLSTEAVRDQLLYKDEEVADRFLEDLEEAGLD